MGADCCIEWRLTLDTVYLDAGLLSPYNTVPSLWRSWPPDTTVRYSRHASQLWNNAALYGRATVRKVSGMAQKCRLEYSASLSRASCFTLPCFSTTSSLGRTSPGQQSMHQTSKLWEGEALNSGVQQLFFGIFISQNPPSKKKNRTKFKPSFSCPNHQTSLPNPARIQRRTRLRMGGWERGWGCSSSAVCSSTCGSHQWEGKRRGVSHIWVLSNTMAHCDHKSHREQSLFREDSGHSPCLAMGQSNDTPGVASLIRFH